MDVPLSLLSGLVAGLALAAPLGAIGVLLIQEGLTRGLRRGMPGAAAVATVDILYCIAAVTAGALAGPVVNGWAPWPQIVGGAALVAMGVLGLERSRRRDSRGADAPITRSGTSLRRFALFIGLTALNPATLVYFAALLTGLESVTGSPSTAVAFVTGVGVASFAWQALLVALGAGLGRKAGPSFRGWTSVIGNGLVVILGAVLIVGSAVP
ncbi:LysE family transporter [Herbiconiux liukaitaii]|uniref:LysE family transporter n=1 Tax=Herbiconiux liukaitaii TaxID=3342799 RepID=UPI0035B74E30